MQNTQKKWLYLIVLSIIWGSSFILIKKSLIGLTPLQVGSARMLFTTIFLLVMGARKIPSIPKDKWLWVALSGVFGTFIPVFLFAYAQTEIDSSVTSIVNSLVPLITLLIGFFVFGRTIKNRQLLGVIIGLAGMLILIFQGAAIHTDQNYAYAFLVLLGSCCYATNVNIVKTYLQNVGPMAIAVGSFIVLLPPALIVWLITTEANITSFYTPLVWRSLGFVALLSFFGTALAKVMFNMLIQMSSPVFATSVTYLIPIVAVCWGIWDGEFFSWQQTIGAVCILLGVYQVNKGAQ